MNNKLDLGLSLSLAPQWSHHPSSSPGAGEAQKAAINFFGAGRGAEGITSAVSAVRNISAVVEEDAAGECEERTASPAGSTHSADAIGGIKRRERDPSEDREDGGGARLERSGSGSIRTTSDEEDGDGGSKKKLRLSKDQAAVLEECFKSQNTLNPKQKVALAKQLNLRPRQVEVWFQNRRARTKLKQTEVDCEYLKRWCDRLSEENRRLEKEVAELRALNVETNQPSMLGQQPALANSALPTTLTMCPSCQRVAPAAATTSNPHTSRKSAAGACSDSFPGNCQFFPVSASGATAAPHSNQNMWRVANVLGARPELF